MMTITWTTEATSQMNDIQSHYFFDITTFKEQVGNWIRANYKQWSNDSKHSKEFIVRGRVQSLTVTITSQIRPPDYIVLVTAVRPGKPV